VLRRLRVDEIADSGQTYGSHAYHDCPDTARADHVPVVYPRAGDAWRTSDGVVLRFIGPSLPFIGSKNAINDNSRHGRSKRDIAKAQSFSRLTKAQRFASADPLASRVDVVALCRRFSLPLSRCY